MRKAFGHPCMQSMNLRKHERRKRHRGAELALEGTLSMLAFEATLRATWAQEGQGDTGIGNVGGCVA